MIYGFAFTRRNISCTTLYSLDGIDYRYLLWGEESIDCYIKKLLEDQPMYILGMGIYKGKDKNKVRIETKCSNKFRRGYVDSDDLIEIEMKPFVNPRGESKIAEGIGKSWCNLISWKITREIEKGNLKSRYTFLHIPTRMNKEIVIDEVQEMVNSL